MYKGVSEYQSLSKWQSINLCSLFVLIYTCLLAWSLIRGTNNEIPGARGGGHRRGNSRGGGYMLGVRWIVIKFGKNFPFFIKFMSPPRSLFPILTSLLGLIFIWQTKHARTLNTDLYYSGAPSLIGADAALFSMRTLFFWRRILCLHFELIPSVTINSFMR